MIRTIWGDPERYKKSYYPEELGGKLYLAGDGSVRDKSHGYFTIMNNTATAPAASSTTRKLAMAYFSLKLAAVTCVVRAWYPPGLFLGY